MDNTINSILRILAVCGPIGGAIAWFLTILLNNRKEILTLQLHLEELRERIKDLEQEVKENRQAFERWKDEQKRNY